MSGEIDDEGKGKGESEIQGKGKGKGKGKGQVTDFLYRNNRLTLEYSISPVSGCPYCSGPKCLDPVRWRVRWRRIVYLRRPYPRWQERVYCDRHAWRWCRKNGVSPPPVLMAWFESERDLANEPYRDLSLLRDSGSYEAG